MVFSFFKKPPEKMVARPAAVPRSTKVPESTSATEGVDAGVVSPPRGSAPVAAPAAALPEPTEFSDFVFSESSPDFQVDADLDPVDAAAEEAAVLFANGQDDAARSVLESAVEAHRAGPAERLWLMLFDLYLLSAMRPQFEALGIDYARAFEKSPPAWRDSSTVSAKPAEPAIPVAIFRGALCASNDAAFADLALAIEKNRRLRVDLSKVSEFDAPGCSRLLGALQRAAKGRREVDLLASEALAARLEVRLESGRAEDQGCWLLFLELCQRLGRDEAFEEAAINYAVTFEVSPPSWEERGVASESPPPAAVDGDALAAGTYTLRGDVKAARFGDLAAYAEARDPLLIDCAQLKRIDFISAGALLNVLTTIRRSGKQIVFRHPNHLVAELFGIVGLAAVATFVADKH